MKKELLEMRLEKLNGILDNESMILLYAASDDHITFLQNKNFFYFTGLDIPEAVLILSKREGKITRKLFIERTIPERIVWDGAKMNKETAREISGIEKIYYLDELERELENELFDLEKVYIEIESPTTAKPLTKPLYWAEQLRLRHPNVVIESLRMISARMRMVKDKWEIEQMSRAIEVTGYGLDKILRETQAGMYEYELEAMLNYELLKNGLRNWGFKPIIAGGKNAVTLHYCRNNEQIAEESLVLIDVGALCNNYSADITRTFPAAASFTARQKEIYTEVLQTQECVIKMIEPGITLKDLNVKTAELLTESLLKLDIIKKREDYRKYYMHSVSHFLGMDAHDVSLHYAKSILEPGNVITVEPGLYIEEEGIGIRIEDDILVTESGYENLSESIPKQVEELEEIRKKAGERK
jgi:Xaa-Pro aminopeptidase